MGGRRVLVVGSQCAALPNSTLRFLPDVADELFEVLADARLGGWLPVAGYAAAMRDPKRAQVLAALDAAFAQADAEGATLLVAFLGHGIGVGGGFYFLPFDGSGAGSAEQDVFLSQVLWERFRDSSRLDGLIVWLDTCHAGVAAQQAAGVWTDLALRRGLRRFEVLTASADQPAYDAAFSRVLIRLLRHGIGTAGKYLTASDVAAPVFAECGPQRPQRLTQDGGGSRLPGDPGLYLGHNPAWRSGPYQVPPPGTSAAAVAGNLTTHFEATSHLPALIERATAERCMAVTGPAGTGKSVLVAALGRPELAPGVVPAGLVHAMVFLDPGSTDISIAYELRDQLRLTLPSFTAAEAAYRSSDGPPEQEWEPLTQEVTGPLRVLGHEAGQVRLVIDGLDQVAASAADAIHAGLDAMVADTRLAHLRLLLTSRDGDLLPAGTTVMPVTAPAQAELIRYLQGRKMPAALSPAVALACSRSLAGGWVLARLFADTHAALSESAQDQLLGRLYRDNDPAGVTAALYNQILADLGANDPNRWPQLRAVLAPLAAAGVGPVLPIGLLTYAAGVFGGPDHPAGVRDIVARLGSLVIRANPGTDHELLGLFHTTLCDHLAAHATPPVDVTNAHRILVDAVETLAPVTGLYTDNPFYRYASTDAHAEHLWQLGQISAAIHALTRRPRPTPRQNQQRWQHWHHRLTTHPERGPNHPDTLTTRGNIAFWTGETGDAAEALRLFRELLPDLQRVLGPNHPDTLATQKAVAYWEQRAQGQEPEQS
ncbi:MAG TPA: tetratricopeptide repeat protein [Mycobacteriales bacterium]|nr:tetratricopeptide repeat protein [Mycobacteriales bacterium]